MSFLSHDRSYISRVTLVSYIFTLSYYMCGDAYAHTHTDTVTLIHHFSLFFLLSYTGCSFVLLNFCLFYLTYMVSEEGERKEATHSLLCVHAWVKFRTHTHSTLPHTHTHRQSDCLVAGGCMVSSCYTLDVHMLSSLSFCLSGARKRSEKAHSAWRMHTACIRETKKKKKFTSLFLSFTQGTSQDITSVRIRIFSLSNSYRLFSVVFLRAFYATSCCPSLTKNYALGSFFL